MPWDSLDRPGQPLGINWKERKGMEVSRKPNPYSPSHSGKTLEETAKRSRYRFTVNHHVPTFIPFLQILGSYVLLKDTRHREGKARSPRPYRRFFIAAAELVKERLHENSAAEAGVSGFFLLFFRALSMEFH